MVVLSRPVLENLSLVKTCKPPTSLICKPSTSFFTGIPVINLSSPDAKNLIIDACEEFGFFKLINHGVPVQSINTLEAQAVNFFSLPQMEKDKACPPNPFGYGSKSIGPNGDVGWIEYLLFSTNPEFFSRIPENQQIFWCAVKDYVSAVKSMCCEVLELIADGLKIGPTNVLSRLLRDEKSDSCFRLNHYPPRPEHEALNNRNLIGFGEHTDPQIISAVRSNNTSGLQISLRDGTWVSVPPDPYSFFVNVGDSLQVMSNGRFRSVRHRVLADNPKSRVSMVFFGGPPLNEKIAPLSSLMAEGEESLYKEFTWCEYKKSAYTLKLGDNRLTPFERASGQ